jgi:hypothetical protein
MKISIDNLSVSRYKLNYSLVLGKREKANSEGDHA